MFSLLLRVVGFPPLARPTVGAVPRLVAAATIALAAAAVAFVFRFGSNCPVQDEWDLLAPVFETPVRWAWVWEYHNEHRYAAAKTIWTALLLATGFDFRAGMAATVLLQAAAAAGVLVLARRLRGSTRAADVLVPAVLLHWGHAFNFLMSYQLAFALAVAGAVGLLAVAATAEPGREKRVGVFAGLGLMLAVLNGGFGLAMAPPVAAWVAYLAWRAKSVVPLVPLAAVVGYVAVTVLNQPKSDVVAVRPPVADLVRAVVDYLAMATGPVVSDGRYRLLPSGLVAGLYVVPVALGVRAAVRRPAERPRVFGLLAVLAGHFVAAAGIAWSRGGGWAPHYVTVSTAGFCAAWLIVARYGPPVGRWLDAAGVFAALALVGFNASAGYHEGQIQRGYFKELFADVNRGVPPTFVAGKFSWNYLVTRSSVAVIPECRARGVGPLAKGVPDPARAAVPVAVPAAMAPWYGEGEPPSIAVPAPAGRVLGLRLVVANAHPSPWASWELSWAAAGGDRRRATVYPPNIRTPRCDVLFWIDGPAADVRLRTLCPTGGYDISKAEWLVEP